MAGKRKKTFFIKTAPELKVLTSPVSLEIVRVLKNQGPCSISTLGPMLGRKANSLHYHVRKLKKLGMIRKTGSRLSGARTEAVYDVTADRFEGAGLHKSESLRKLAVESVGSLCRLAAREFELASGNKESLAEKPPKRNIFAHRYSARLTESQISAVNDHLRAIEEIFIKNIGSEKGQLCALTAVLVPLNRK